MHSIRFCTKDIPKYSLLREGISVDKCTSTTNINISSDIISLCEKYESLIEQQKFLYNELSRVKFLIKEINSLPNQLLEDSELISTIILPGSSNLTRDREFTFSLKLPPLDNLTSLEKLLTDQLNIVTIKLDKIKNQYFILKREL